MALRFRVDRVLSCFHPSCYSSIFKAEGQRENMFFSLFFSVEKLSGNELNRGTRGFTASEGGPKMGVKLGCIQQLFPYATD